MKKAIFFILIFVLINLTGFFLFFKIASLNEVVAGTEHNVFGFAWSENIGWLSFNSTNCDSDSNGITDQGNYPQCPVGEPSKDYGVDIDDTGIFSGYAWSENIGWLSFKQADLSGCPSGSCQAKMDLATGNVSGWARALAYEDGWDGWLSLRGSNYGVKLNLTGSPKTFEGWAWGSDVIGWLSFNHLNCDSNNDGISDQGNYSQCPIGKTISTYKVESTFNFPPTVGELSVSPEGCCTTPSEHFSWTFSDPDKNPQAGFQLQVDKEGNFAVFGSGEVDFIGGASSDKLVLIAKDPGYDQLGYRGPDNPYYWQVKVWDTGGGESNWVQGPSFTTPLHIYPQPNFNWSPRFPAKGEIVQFSDTSTCYNSSNNPISCSGKTFLWTFPVGTEFATGSSPASENPQVKFNTTGPQTVSLQITDDVGVCVTTKAIGVTLPLPKWKEISP